MIKHMVRTHYPLLGNSRVAKAACPELRPGTETLRCSLPILDGSRDAELLTCLIHSATRLSKSMDHFLQT